MAKITAPENKTIGSAMEAKASALATVLNAGIMPELDRINVAKEDWEGGKFAVMFKVSGLLTPEQIAELPDPKVQDGNNPGIYKVKVVKIDSKGKHKEEWKEHRYYRQLALSLPGVIAVAKRVAQLERSLDSEKDHSDIGSDILNMDKTRRNAEIAKLKRRVNTAVSSIDGAFELFHQFRRFQDLRLVNVAPIFTVNSDGTLNDGDEGRPVEVEATTTPIMIRSTVKGREGIDSDMVSVGTFLRYDVDKAKENGGGYDAVIQTAKREKKTDEQGTGNTQDQSKPQAVNTADTAIARIVDVHEYVTRAAEDKSRAMWDGLSRELHGAGSDESFMSAYELKEYLVSLVGGPKDAIRYQALVNDQADKIEGKAA